MKGLAEYVMRGRMQALLVTLAGASILLFSWISAAVIALVTLRKGAGPGAWLLFWALLPAAVIMLLTGDSGPFALLIGTAVLAVVLRTSVSLPVTSLVAVAVAACTGALLLAFGVSALEQMAAFFGQFLEQLEQRLAEGSQNGEVISLHRPGTVQIAGMLGLVNGMTSMLCLLLARWWQAALYNPGGFGEEFRAFRLSPAVALALALACVGLYMLGVEYRSWAMIFVLPLTFSGLALVHARAVLRGQGSGWLTVFYLLWLFFDPVKLIVVLAAIADSVLDFRQRWRTRAAPAERRDDDQGQD